MAMTPPVRRLPGRVLTCRAQIWSPHQRGSAPARRGVDVCTRTPCSWATGRFGVTLEGGCGSMPERWPASRWRDVVRLPNGEAGPLSTEPHTSPRSALQRGWRRYLGKMGLCRARGLGGSLTGPVGP